MRAPAHSLALSAGATLTAPNRTNFRFWAPDVAKVDLEIDGGSAQPMQAAPDGWHSLDVSCGAGTHYRFRIAPDLAVPDPASRAQAGDVGGFSIVVDPAAYSWRNTAWRGRPWREAIVYETHVGLAGGFRGLMEELPGLADLGITAIELMPIADFPGERNWGYDGVLPYAPAAAYGGPDDLKALIDRAHDLRLMVLQDVVYNHFGPQGNHLNSYASAFFRTDLHTPWGAAIDFSNPVVRRFFIENALYWLEEYRFDGLRLDAVHAIPDRGWLLELAETVRDRIADRLVHLVLENDHNDAGLLEDAYTAQWNDDAHHAAHVLITGEAGGYYSDYADHPAAMMARCLAEGFAFQGQASDYRGGAERGTPSSHLPPSRFVFFLQNHDQIGNRALGERLAAIADPDSLRVGVALLLLSPQIPLLFMGEERGAREPFLYFTGYEGELAEAVKHGRRKEFGKFPAFATPEAQQQIPDPNKAETFERSRPNFDAGDDWAQGWLGFYRDLIALRRAHIVPRLDSARTLAATALGPTAVSASWAFGDGTVLGIAANFGTAPVDLPAPVSRRIFAYGGRDRRSGSDAPGPQLRRRSRGAGMKPRATIRLQFNRDFTLDDAVEWVAYFRALGVSHLYASPLLAARAGSTHGYDVIDPTEINPELGGYAALTRLHRALQRHEMGLILDIVPNHMAADAANPWWWDVLMWGRSSRYAEFFDIDWGRSGAHGQGAAAGPRRQRGCVPQPRRAAPRRRRWSRHFRLPLFRHLLSHRPPLGRRDHRWRGASAGTVSRRPHAICRTSGGGAARWRGCAAARRSRGPAPGGATERARAPARAIQRGVAIAGSAGAAELRAGALAGCGVAHQLAALLRHQRADRAPHGPRRGVRRLSPSHP